MEFLKFFGDEICCFLKSSYDIAIQKIQQVLKGKAHTSGNVRTLWAGAIDEAASLCTLV